MSASSAPVAFLATGAHAAGYLLVTAAVAALVFEKFGVALLRRASGLGDRLGCDGHSDLGTLAGATQRWFHKNFSCSPARRFRYRKRHERKVLINGLDYHAAAHILHQPKSGD